jgi:hypothetical protein
VREKRHKNRRAKNLKPRFPIQGGDEKEFAGARAELHSICPERKFVRKHSGRSLPGVTLPSDELQEKSSALALA